MKQHILIKLMIMILALQACTPKKPKMNCKNVGDGDNGHNSGYQCNMNKHLREAELSPTLGAYSSASCTNPQLRVDILVFTLVNDIKVLNFRHLQRAENLPKNTGTPIELLALQLAQLFLIRSVLHFKSTWSVSPKCAKLDINSVDENHAQGVRKLVINLSYYQKSGNNMTPQTFTNPVF